MKVAAKVDPIDEKYFRDHIKPLLADPRVEFVGEVNDAEKASLLGNALAVLFPIDWPEPFGLVMIEAMSVGTPVICWRAGSVPEVIEHGVSGMIVDSVESAVKAVSDVHNLSRLGVRQAFEKRFTAERMANNYVAAYCAILSRSTRGEGPQRAASRPRRELPSGSSDSATAGD